MQGCTPGWPAYENTSSSLASDSLGISPFVLFVILLIVLFCFDDGVQQFYLPAIFTVFVRCGVSVFGFCSLVLKLLDIACGRAGAERLPVEGYLVLLSQSITPADSHAASATSSLTSTTTLVNAPVTNGLEGNGVFGSRKVSLGDSGDHINVIVSRSESLWEGHDVEVELSKETARALNELQVGPVMF